MATESDPALGPQPKCPKIRETGKRCGSDLIQFGSDRVNFCTYCGWKVDWEAVLQANKVSAEICGGNLEDNKVCVNLLMPDAKFCSRCGRTVADSKFLLYSYFLKRYYLKYYNHYD